MEKIIIKQELTDGEKYRMALLIMLRSKVVRRMLRILLFPAAFLFIFIFTMYGIDYTPDGPSYNPVVPFIFPLVVILLLIVGPFIFIKLKKTGNPVYEFDDWGMTVLFDGKTINVPWNDLSSYSELPDFLLIAQESNDLGTHVIPKREFKNEAQLKNFMDLLILQKLKRK